MHGVMAGAATGLLAVLSKAELPGTAARLAETLQAVANLVEPSE